MMLSALKKDAEAVRLHSTPAKSVILSCDGLAMIENGLER